MYPLVYPYVFRALILQPATIRYAYQQFLIIPPPLAWHLGRFIPMPGTPICNIGIAPACVPLLADGIIFEVGSSFPGQNIP
jgi:hypothetical protein